MNQPGAMADDCRPGVADWWWAAGGALLWTLVLFAVPPTPFQGMDVSRYFEPYADFFRTSLLRGELPWWNPYASLGRPFLADLQTASFYPATFLSVPFGVRGGWVVATGAHGLLAILGFIRLMRWFGVTRPAAWAGAVVFLFSAPFLARMQAGSVNFVFGLCYLPLGLCLAGQLAVAPTRRRWAALALVWGLQLLCSHPQPFWLSVLGAAAFVTGRTAQPPWGAALRLWLRAMVTMLTAAACGMASLGLVLVPFVELIGQSNRAASSLAFSAKFAMNPDHWISLISAPSGALAVNWEYDAHAGVVALIGGMVALTRWRDPVTRGLALMVLVGAAIAAGNSTPMFGLLYNVLPGLASFRIPARAGALVVFGLVSGAAVLAGAKPARPQARGSVLFAGVLLVAAVAYYYSQRLSAAGAGAAGWFHLELALVIAAVAAWWLWLNRRDHERTVVTWGRRLALPGVLVTELFLSVRGLKHLPAHPGQISDFSVESVVSAAIHGRRLDREAAPVRVCLPPTLLRENSGMVNHYATLTGFESLSLARVWTYLHRAAGADPDQPYNTSPDGRVYESATRLGSVNLTVTLPADSGVLAINATPDPRAYLVTRFTAVAGWQAAITAMLAGHPFHADALIEPPYTAGLAFGPAQVAGLATIERFDLNSLEVAVESPGAALLVVAEAWYPGWRASIAGREVPCFPVNGWMRGVRVPAGRSVVRLAYHQNGLLAGSVLSLVAGLVLVWAGRSRTAVAPGRTEQGAPDG